MKDNPYYTLDNIPKHRQEYINLKVREFIKVNKIKKWPLDMVEIILDIVKHQRIPLHIESVVDLSIRADATTIYMAELKKYFMFVNRNKIVYPFKVSKHRRLNFTLAHEIGHILLEHIDLPTDLKSDDEKLQEEYEADEFAGRLLMPKNFVIECNFTSIPAVAKHFNVSESALLKRLSNLDRQDIRKSKLIHVCENCGNSDILGTDDYCTICGNYIKYNNRGISKMKYDDGFFENEETNRLYNCPICGNRDIGDEDNYCIICGHSVTNECTECGNYAEPHARYCRHCGKDTLFNMYGILDDWKIAKDALTDKMEYELNLAKDITKIKELDTWNTYIWSLYHDDKEPLFTLLEGSTAKLCGETVVIYVSNDKYKEILESTHLINDLYALIPSYLEVKAAKIQIKTLNEFYASVRKEADEAEIPF